MGEVSQIPQGSQKILSLFWTFNHLADLELNGYFALDSGLFLFSAWQAPDGSFYALAVYGGIWHTYRGLLSPVAGVPEPKSGTGTWLQAEFSHFTGTYTGGSLPTHGFLGSVNAGGTTVGLLSNPQVETVGVIDLSVSYFDNYSGPTYVDLHDDLGWDYQYFPTGQEFCGEYNFITDAYSIAGDIVT